MMKLIMAIVHSDDARKVMSSLNAKGFTVTKLCSTGGFLKSGNTTLLIGVESNGVHTVIDIIKRNSHSRKQTVDTSTLPISMDSIFSTYNDGNIPSCTAMAHDTEVALLDNNQAEVTVGSATIFVLGTEKFEKV